jgi:hypothetical protein
MVEILVAGITTLGLILVAVITNRTRQHAKATREQVENSHETNLRHDLDDHGRKIDSLAARFERFVEIYEAEHPPHRRRRRLYERIRL